MCERRGHRFVHDSKELSGKFKKIGNRAVRKAREENRRLGIPNTTVRDGVVHYDMPDGEIVRKNPFTGEDAD